MIKSIKKNLIISFAVISILLLVGTMGCIEMESFDYNENTQVVTLNGKAPRRDFLERILCNKDTYSTADPSVEFRFYKNANSNYRNSIRTVEKDSLSLSGDYAYFSANIDDLEPNTKYHVRAFGYYQNIDPDAYESGWGYSEMISFTPSKSYDKSVNVNTNSDFKVRFLKEIIEKNPKIKEILIKNYLDCLL